MKDEGWHFFHIRPITEEEKESFSPEIAFIVENAPDEGIDVLIWDGENMLVDRYIIDDFAYLDSIGEIDEGMAWRYLPEPPEEK